MALNFVLVTDDEALHRLARESLPAWAQCERVDAAQCVDLLLRRPEYPAVIDAVAMSPEIRRTLTRLGAQGAHPPLVLHRPASVYSPLSRLLEGYELLTLREWRVRAPFVLRRAFLETFRRRLAARVITFRGLPDVLVGMFDELLLARDPVRSVQALATRLGRARSTCYSVWKSCTAQGEVLSCKDLVDGVLLLRTIQRKEDHVGWHRFVHQSGVRMQRLTRVSLTVFGAELHELLGPRLETCVERFGLRIGLALRLGRRSVVGGLQFA